MDELPINLYIDPVTYENNDEYQAAMRLICRFSNGTDYDQDNMRKVLDYVWEKTCNNDQFMELYKLAAEQRMISECIIGLVLLFSYDHLKEFYILFSRFSAMPEESIEDHPCYLSLKAKLTAK
jgi:hypothetical protein